MIIEETEEETEEEAILNILCRSPRDRIYGDIRRLRAEELRGTNGRGLHHP